MGASLEFHSLKGERRVLLSDFYKDDGIDRFDLQKGEILTAIHLPQPPGFVAHRGDCGRH